MEVGQITPDWLRRTFGWPITDANAISIEPLSLTNGTMGGVFRVRCGAHSMVYKCSPSLESPWYRIYLEGGLLDREIDIYRFLGSLQCDQRKIAPECLWSRSTSEGGAALALQDVDQGCSVMDRFIAGLAKEESLAVLQTLATLHGTLVTTSGDPLKPPLPWLCSALDDYLVKAIAEGLSAAQNLVQTLFPRDFPQRRLLRILDADIANVVGRCHSGARVLSLCHGDCWATNVLFTGAGGERRALLIDWQFAIWGNPLADVAGLLLSSLSPGQRRKWSSDLLMSYHQRLREGLADYSFDECRQEFCRALPFAALVCVATLDAYTSGLSAGEVRQVAARMEIIMDDVPELFGAS